MITYNHEEFVEEAIESILSQECTFDFELVISDDKSPDGTKDKIEQIIQNHPKGNKIRFIPQDPNLGMMKNFGFALQQAKGEYIAICEGDDYWTDRTKLQKQFDILESNQNCVLSFHNATVYNQNTKESKAFNSYSKEFYTSDEMFDTWLIPTASSFFRNVIPTELPDFLIEGTHGDLALFLLLGESGSFHCTNEVMSVYRINDQGVTQSGFKGIAHNLKHIKQLEDMELYFGEKHSNALNDRVALYNISNAMHYANCKQVKESRSSLKKALKRKPSLRNKKASFILRLFLKNILNK